ncbi:Alternative splicing regulator [Popillia japonica]|uniref:Alternative splicing regulator n=1 Tax=Popillia japonica TaxID=7064 RepID=A0AAW1KQ32_POPJA
MWHEARKQERRIRGMLVDYRKRAERRRDFYEKIKADPTQFLQLHGRQCKIHLDPAVAAAADSPAAMMPWQGHADNLIDRFDVRAHLDFIPPIKKADDEEATYDERQLNYERYRIIAQNSFLGITEEKFLKQLHLEEQFGYTETEPKKKKTGGAAIGFNYEDGTGPSQPVQLPQGNSSDEQSDSDLDVDLSINVSKMDSTQAHEMNRHGRNFGMSTNDFYSFLTNDLEEAENYRLAKEEEHEKALFSGRKSRRERRAHREKRLANRVISPPSYAARTSPTYPMFRESKSASKSPSPENSGKITYITSFGDDDEPASSSKPTYADKVKYGKSKKLSETPGERRTVYVDSKRRSRSKEGDRFSKRGRSRSPDLKNRRSRSPNRYRRSRSRNRSRRYRSRRSISSSSSRSPTRPRRRDRSTSRSASKYKSRSRNRSYTRSRSASRENYAPRSRSRSRSKNVSRSVSRTQSNPLPKTSSRSSSSSSSSSRNPAVTVKKSPTRSRSSSTKSSMSVDRSRSRSASLKKDSPPKVIPRYYGRKRSDQSSSDLSDAGDEDVDMKPETAVTVTANKSSGNSGTATKKSNASLSLQERLKRKRQALLNKQFKADKIAEQLKTEREKQEQQNREDELREMAIKLRRRQRERRHAYDSNSSSSSDSESKPRSPASNPEGMVVESGAGKERAVAVGGRRNLVTTLNVGSFIEMKVIKIRRITEDVTTREKIPGEIETEIVLRVAKNPVDLWLIIEYFNFIDRDSFKSSKESSRSLVDY